MRTLLITNDFPPNNPGGMNRYYSGLASGFPADEIEVLTVRADEHHDEEFAFPIHRTRVTEEEVRRFLNNRHWYSKAREILGTREFDYILCGNFRPFAYVTYWLHRKLGIPYFIFFHGNDLLRVETKIRNNPLKRWFYPRIVNSAAGFVANSSFTANLIRKKLEIHDTPVFICLPGLDADLLHQPPAPPFPENGGQCRLVTVGRLTRRKGIDVVIRALGRIRSEIPELRYSVIGKGDPAPYLELAREHQVDNLVEFPGYVTPERLPDIYRSHDVLVMVSRMIEQTDNVEGFGIVYLEGNAFGKPVIGSRSGGITDAVEEGKTGLLVDDPTDPSEVGEKILELYRNPVKARRMGEYGYNRVNRDFRWERSAMRLRDEIRECLSG